MKIEFFFRLTFVCLTVATLALASCETIPALPEQKTPQYPPTQKPVSIPQKPIETPKPIRAKPYTPEHMRGEDVTRVALLLPFSAKSSTIRKQANQMLRAAELAIFSHANDQFLLMPFDTKGTYSGAQTAAEDSLSAGAQIVIGPMLSDSLHAVRPLANRAGVPVISFSTDESQAGNGIYLLNFTANSDIEKMVSFLTRQGISRFAIMAPSTRYGQSATAALDQATARHGGFVVARSFYNSDKQDIDRAAKELAKQKELFEAVLIPESGSRLREVAPLLPYHGVNISRTTLFGTSLWDDNRIERESALNGAVFPAPDPDIRKKFEEDFETIYGYAPSRLASLAHDATAITAFLSQRQRRQPFSRHAIENPDGYIGVDGLVRFTPTGVVQRELAVISVSANGFEKTESSARSFGNNPYYGN